jgi:hypothetical protein
LGGLGGTTTIPNSVVGKLLKPSMVISFQKMHIKMRACPFILIEIVLFLAEGVSKE